MKTRRMSRGLLWVLPALLAVGAASAQEPQAAVPPDDPERDAESPGPEPRLRIRVLEHPYDLASFYRSSPGARAYGHGLLGALSQDVDQRHPLARYYRQGPASRNGYSRFWSSGYGDGPEGSPYQRTIGENGDLYLMAPTFLAPVGPLASSFEDDEP